MIGKIAQRMHSDQRGAAVIELALAAPVLAAMIIGMSDMARAYSMKVMLEQAAARTIEQVEQQKSVASTYTTALTTEATNAMSDAGYASGNSYTADAWLECAASGSTTWTRQSDFNGNCPNSTDTTARYASITIRRTFMPMFPSRIWPGANADGSINLSGSAEVRIQ